MSTTTYAKIIMWIRVLVVLTMLGFIATILMYAFYKRSVEGDNSPSKEYLIMQRQAEDRYRLKMESLAKEHTRSIEILAKHDSVIITEIKTSRSIFSKEIKASNEKISRIGNYQSPDITRAFAELEDETKR